ncbi:MAG: hypothetical protein KDD50_15420, partial [Bdellovibrionales bacterium]|nr:hypothetical protein [Bdellovibrionales bacterium]
MSNFDVHRALRFLVGILILFSNIIFLESLWWVSWLVSILLIISGITDLYPLTQFISLIDFEALLKKDSYQKNKFLETGVATKAIGIILNFVILLSFSAVLWRLPYQKYQIQEAYNDQISQLKASLENYYYKHNGFFGLKKENLPIFTRYPNAYLQMSFLGSEKTLWGLGTHKAQQNDWTRESLNIDGKKYLLEISLPSIHKEYIKFRNSLFLLITLSLSLFSYFLMSVIHYYIGKPLNKMVQYTQKVSNGKPDDELHFNFNDEFIELANFINQTLDSLLEQKQMLKNEEDRHKQSEQLLNIAKEETIRANEA